MAVSIAGVSVSDVIQERSTPEGGREVVPGPGFTESNVRQLQLFLRQQEENDRAMAINATRSGLSGLNQALSGVTEVRLPSFIMDYTEGHANWGGLSWL